MDDVGYLIRRAEQEVELAQSAIVPAVVSAHYRMSNAYLERAQSLAASSEVTATHA